MKKILSVLALACLVSFNAAAYSADVPEYSITIKDHKFSPTNLEIPANQKVKLIIKNEDKTPEEFESHDLNREKIVGGGSQINVYVGPLKSGTYKYFGDFNQKTAQGTITAK